MFGEKCEKKERTLASNFGILDSLPYELEMQPPFHRLRLQIEALLVPILSRNFSAPKHRSEYPVTHPHRPTPFSPALSCISLMCLLVRNQTVVLHNSSNPDHCPFNLSISSLIEAGVNDGGEKQVLEWEASLMKVDKRMISWLNHHLKKGLSASGIGG
ncbi:hypothetical protein L484_015904 [Morus notabilis]|uniref:Uncharacterized protein n=1 Tax=Morus notabilis TaxID=981085 RepID=W9QX25_9ROSA|nr:uncharacterized protein LOC21398982 [Morus notabilis]EXB46043.1 hypothetical protein L484_015904 [Morus notabilis]